MSDRYTLDLPDVGITFIAERLRRDRHELIGELTVRCTLPGAKAVNGYLSTGDFNFSSVRARQDRARLLTQRCAVDGIDWFGLVEEVCQRVFQAEREGEPDVDLRTLPRPQPDDEIRVQGLSFPRRHPSILFGDGGAAKSYTALFIAGILAHKGLSVALFDWELCGEDHRDRLERLFGPDSMPVIRYALCERPLTAEVDRLRRIVRQRKIDYAIYDSVAPACDGPPEAAEVASRYFRAVREIGAGIGSLHIAHVNKTGDTSEYKPFGSTFWHNLARCTWFVKAVEQAGNDATLTLGFYNRKSNLGAIQPPVSYLVRFGALTTFTTVDIADSPELAGKLTIKQRMYQLLKRGAMSISDIATELDASYDTVSKSVHRNPRHFVVLEGGKVGLRTT